MFFNGRNGLDWVKDQLKKTTDATLAVAFWGDGAIGELGLDNRSKSAGPVSIICNLKMGGTNPDEIASLMKISGVKVQQCDRLHGKVYLFENEAMVGSSNASANGLSFQGRDALGWDEANIMVDDPAQISSIRDWIANLACRDINDDDMVKAERVWKSRRRTICATVIDRSIEDVLKDGSASLAGRGVYVVVHQEAMTKAGLAELKKVQRDYGPKVDAYEGWDELPTNGTLISFFRGPKGGLKYDGSWTRNPDIPDRGNLQLCFPTEKPPLGLKKPSNEMPTWKRVVDWLVKDDRPVGQDSSQFEDISLLCGAIDDN